MTRIGASRFTGVKAKAWHLPRNDLAKPVGRQWRKGDLGMAQLSHAAAGGGTITGDGAKTFDEALFVSVIIAAGMGAGLLVPGFANMVAPLLLPSLFVIVTASLLPFRTVLVRSLLGFDRHVVVVVAWLQIALPILVVAGGTVLQVPRDIMPFVLLSACSGAVFATPTLAGLFDLDRARAARIMIMSTLLMPISICLFVGPRVGLDNIGAFQTFGYRVFVFLVIPALLVLGYRLIELGGLKGASEQADRQAPRVGVVALSVFAVAIMAGVAEQFASHPSHTLALFLGALCVNFGMLIITRLALGSLGADTAHTASIVAMTRNVGLAYAMTAAFFGPDLATYVALCQVPLLVGPLIVRLRFRS